MLILIFVVMLILIFVVTFIFIFVFIFVMWLSLGSNILLSCSCYSAIGFIIMCYSICLIFFVCDRFCYYVLSFWCILLLPTYFCHIVFLLCCIFIISVVPNAGLHGECCFFARKHCLWHPRRVLLWCSSDCDYLVMLIFLTCVVFELLLLSLSTDGLILHFYTCSFSLARLH